MNFKQKIERRLKRLQKEIAEFSKDYNGNETAFTAHGGRRMGLLEGRETVYLDILEAFEDGEIRCKNELNCVGDYDPRFKKITHRNFNISNIKDVEAEIVIVIGDIEKNYILTRQDNLDKAWIKTLKYENSDRIRRVWINDRTTVVLMDYQNSTCKFMNESNNFYNCNDVVISKYNIIDGEKLCQL